MIFPVYDNQQQRAAFSIKQALKIEVNYPLSMDHGSMFYRIIS